MSDNGDDSKITLSRRKTLAGIGTIGAASALGLGGTYAQFTDTEEHTATFTAGAIDGTVSWSGSYNGNEVTGELTNVDTSGEGVDGTIHLKDVKPGDYWCVNFGIEVQNNPAWVASCLGYSDDIDHRNYEPEMAADGDVDAVNEKGDSATSDGELAENILALPYYDSDGSCTFFDPNGIDSDDLPNDFSVPSAFWSNSEAGGSPETYLAPRTIEDVANSAGSLNTKQWNGGEPITIDAPEGASVGKGCVFLDGGQAGGSSSDNTRGVSGLKPGTTLYFGYDFHLPFDTGNVAQGDRIDIDFGFNFLQKRHTSAPEFGSYSPGSNTPGES